MGKYTDPTGGFFDLDGGGKLDAGEEWIASKFLEEIDKEERETEDADSSTDTSAYDYYHSSSPNGYQKYSFVPDKPEDDPVEKYRNRKSRIIWLIIIIAAIIAGTYFTTRTCFEDAEGNGAGIVFGLIFIALIIFGIVKLVDQEL